MLVTDVQASYLCSPKMQREALLQNAYSTTKKVEKTQHIFGRIKKVLIFALPIKNGVVKKLLSIVKQGETVRV
jgi:hypothetical protein